MEFYIIEALLGALMFGIGGLLFKWNTHNGGQEIYFFSGLYLVGTTCFLIEGYGQMSVAIDPIYHIMAAVVALGSAGGNYAFSQGLRLGPAGLSSAFNKANVVIVILISSLIYNEKLSTMELLGTLSFVTAMLVVNLRTRQSKKTTSSKWFVVMVICMLLVASRNGGLKVANEMELVSPVIVFLAYGYCAVFFGVATFLKRADPWPAKVSKGTVVFMGCMTGIVSYSGLYFYINALEDGPGGVVVTLFSLDMFFLLAMAYLFFGERLNFHQKIGFGLSALGIVLIGLN